MTLKELFKKSMEEFLGLDTKKGVEQFKALAKAKENAKIKDEGEFIRLSNGLLIKKKNPSEP